MIANGQEAEPTVIAGPPALESGPPAEPASRLTGIVRAPVLNAVHAGVVVACSAIAALTSTGANWRPLGLFAVLFAFTAVAEFGAVWFPRQIAGSLASVGLAIAMTFLGPAPAVLIAVVTVSAESVHRRVSWGTVVSNAATYALFSLLGSLAIGAALGGHPPTAQPKTLLFAVIVLVFASDALSFAYVALSRALYVGQSIRRSIRYTFVPLSAFNLVTAAFTAAAAVVYVTAGLASLAALLALLLLSGRLMQAIALAEERGQQVADLAIARARLLAEALTAEERERVRLAGEIHDDALQELALAQLDLRAADHDAAALKRGRRSLEKGIDSIRGTLSRIVPAAEMRSVGLDSALEALAADLCGPARLSWDVMVHASVADYDRTLVCSLARELVTNVVKHADASRVDIRVEPAAEGVRLRVADDGRGFSGARDAGAGHVGLAIVENRARAADGRLEIRSAPGQGTVATVELEADR